MSSIEINSSKLVEWIVTRLKLNKDWRNKVNIIREKISNALSDMPENEEIKDIINGNFINYYHCKNILAILSDTEKESKNIFGRYSSQRYKDWQEIVKLYENNYSFLVDAAQIMNQNVTFELPALRKSMDKHEKSILESQRKQKSFRSLLDESNVNLRDLYEKYKIKPVDSDCGLSNYMTQIRAELTDNLSAKISVYVEQFLGDLSRLKPIVDLYMDFLVKNELIKSLNDAKECEIVRYLLNKGNTTIFEYKHGIKPQTAPDKTDKKGELDSISWPEEDTDLVLDLDLSIVEEDSCGADLVCIESDFEHNNNNQNNCIVRDEETNTNSDLTNLLENLDFHQIILDELYEVMSFLECIHDETNELTYNVNEDSSVMRQTLERSISQLESNQWHHLLHLSCNNNVSNSVKTTSYLSGILHQFSSEFNTRSKYSQYIDLFSQRELEASCLISAAQNHYELLIKNTHLLKSQMEQSLSPLFDQRNIRIVGAISTI